MSEAIQSTLEADAAARVAPAKVVLTKEEKIAKLEADIARLTAKLDDVRNDREPVKTAKVKKAAYVPQIGERVLATVGRNTATSKARVEVGIVRAIKLGEDLGEGKRSQTQVRVEFGTGFDAQFVTLYPAQLQPEGDVQETNAQAAFEASAPGLSEAGIVNAEPGDDTNSGFVAGA